MVSIIAAVARDGAIGVRDGLPFHLSPDLRHFKEVTVGKPVVMGRKTFESLPGGALPKRRNIVITRNRSYEAQGIETAHSLSEALELTADEPETMIIGGGEIYSQAMGVCDRIYLTEIDEPVADADTFFPKIPEEFRRIDVGEWLIDERTGLRFRFVTLQR